MQRTAMYQAALILSFFSFIIAGYSQPAGWSNREAFYITENTGSTLYNYQVRLKVNTQLLIGGGMLQANGEDLRFGGDCAGNVLYNYWIESGINTDSTVIWVKMDSLAGGSVNALFMYYGNPSATAVSAIHTTFSGPHSATDSVSNTNQNIVGDSQRGFRFAPNQDILATAFGKNEPHGTTRYITLFDFASQAILRQMQVSGPAAQYSYTNLPAPIWLTQGTQYLLEIFQNSSEGYYYGAGPQIGQHLTYLDMRYCNGCTQNTFPTNTLTGIHYGYVDMWYFTRTHAAQEPTVSIAAPLSLNPGNTNGVCPGSSIALGMPATGGFEPYSYLWTSQQPLNDSTSAGITVTPLASATYTQYVTDAAACTDSAVFTINVLPLPLVSAGNDQALCPGNQVTLSGSGADTYTWSGGISDGVPFTPAATASYTVTGTAANGCQATDTVMVSLLDCSGLDKQNVLNLKLYPNPAGDILNLEGDWNAAVEIRITDMSGKTFVFRKTPVSGLITLDISSLPAGVYQLGCYYGSKVATGSFVRTEK